jgi:hypothetical protein
MSKETRIIYPAGCGRKRTMSRGGTSRRRVQSSLIWQATTSSGSDASVGRAAVSDRHAGRRTFRVGIPRSRPRTRQMEKHAGGAGIRVGWTKWGPRAAADAPPQACFSGLRSRDSEAERSTARHARSLARPPDGHCDQRPTRYGASSVSRSRLTQRSAVPSRNTAQEINEPPEIALIARAMRSVSCGFSSPAAMASFSNAR